MTDQAATFREIAAIIARYASVDGTCLTPIDFLFFSRLSAPSEPFHKAQTPCFALVAQGAKTLTLGNEVFHYGVGSCLVVSLDVPIVGQVTEASVEVPHLGLGLTITSDRLKELFTRINVPEPAVADSMRGVAVHKAGPELLDAILRLLKLLDHPQDIAAMAPLIEQEILYRLLTGPHGPTLMRIARADSPSNKIAKAISWLRQNSTSQLRIDDLATHVGMSVSSLHHHFSAATAMTPMQYQKRLRLHEARRLMLVERLDVGTAGYRVGYQSPSQFSREYSRLYGLSPLRDVESLRGTLRGEVESMPRQVESMSQ